MAMIDILRIATAPLAEFLAQQLPSLSDDWWQKNVYSRLTFQQQRVCDERGLRNVQHLDLAALLRVLDQNWYEISDRCRFPRESRSWIKELQAVRNKWAHLSAEAMAPGELYRDADTLGRVLLMIDADQETLATVERAKADAVKIMANGAAAEKAAPDDARIGSSASAILKAAEAEHEAEKSALFKVGDLVVLRSKPDELIPVIEVVPSGVENRYVVFSGGTKATYYESQLAPPPDATDSAAQASPDELRAHLTSLQLLAPSTSILYSLRSGRVQFVPYQYRPVLKLIHADRPRLLIADEVGVGKTIEAGLIIKELRARMDIASVLVICPKALVAERKWLLEMKRFDEHFTALDGPMLRHCMQETHLEGQWPEQYSKAIVPFSLFDSDLINGDGGKRRRGGRGLLDLDPPPKFDLVVVDEAHHIRNPETYLHEGVRYFCDNADAVVFLTATPVQLGSEDLFTLLNALRPDLVVDRASFEQMAAPNVFINTAVQFCRRAEKGWQNEARHCLERVAQTEWGRLFVRESPAFQEAYDRLGSGSVVDAERVELIHKLERLYTFDGLVNRTRRRDIGEFTTRKPETVSVPFTPAQLHVHDTLLEIVARVLSACHGQTNVNFMMTTLRRQAASCLYGLVPFLEDMLNGKLDLLELAEITDAESDAELDLVGEVGADIESLLEDARRLEPYDPKLEAFMKVVRGKGELENNKSLVFSTFRHTLSYLAASLASSDLRFGLIHGGVGDEDRSELRRRFALPKEDAEAIDVLLSSEVGCEGLDFQFCDLLINYDLPWNPMRIEQRIGRIDRYGQKSEAVAVINLITPGTVDADIYDRCLWRIGVFHHAIGGSEEILGEITAELHAIAERLALTPDERDQRLRQLGDNAIRQIQEEQALEAKQAELFGLNVPPQEWRAEIERAESVWLRPAALQHCVATYLDSRFGGDGEYLLGEKNTKTLRLNQEARHQLLDDFRALPRATDPVAREWERWLKGAQPTLSVTFDQEAAREDRRLVYLSVLHPLLRQAARALSSRAPLHVSLQIGTESALPEGAYPFALYRWQWVGVKADESLVAVGLTAQVDDAVLPSIPSAVASAGPCHATDAQLRLIDERHYERWRKARADHQAVNRELVEHRVHSLTVGHHARCDAIKDQLAKATNDKIIIMKQSELARANLDFAHRLEELEQAANQADVHASLVVTGVLTIA